MVCFVTRCNLLWNALNESPRCPCFYCIFLWIWVSKLNEMGIFATSLCGIFKRLFRNKKQHRRTLFYLALRCRKDIKKFFEGALPIGAHLHRRRFSVTISRTKPPLGLWQNRIWTKAFGSNSSVTINMLKDEVEKHPERSHERFDTDGFPRLKAQAEALAVLKWKPIRTSDVGGRLEVADGIFGRTAREDAENPVACPDDANVRRLRSRTP